MKKEFQFVVPMFLALLVCLSGCPESRQGLPCFGENCRTEDSGSDAGFDIGPDVDDIVCPTNKVDMLFVVDNSSSMEQEQLVLSNQIVIMVQELISPTDPDDPAVQDLHIGIVSTDMGVGGYTIQTCSNPIHGDNGVLQNRGFLSWCSSEYSASDCDVGVCPWLDHSLEYPDDGRDSTNPPIWEDFGCVATLGTNGCGFEQQLEASLVALTLQSDPGGANEGFLRPDSVLVIVYVTDEDDCSTPAAEMFNPSADLGSLNVRCALHEEMLYPISRYHDAFVGLRNGNADRVVVAAITGVPIDGSWLPGDDIDVLRGLRQLNPSNPNELLRSCDTDMGGAYPPVRFAELVYAFGENGVLESICRDDWSDALESIAHKIQKAMEGSPIGCP